MENYYTFLELGSYASKEEVKKSYRRLSKIHHPDFGGNPRDFLKLNEAYKTLSDDYLRAEYDSSILREELFSNIIVNENDNSTRKTKFMNSVREYLLRRRYYYSSLIPLSVVTFLQIDKITSRLEISNPLFVVIEIMFSTLISKVVINAIANASDLVMAYKYLLVLATSYITLTGIFGTFSQFCGSIFFTCLGLFIIDYIHGKLISLKDFVKSLTSNWHYYMSNK